MSPCPCSRVQQHCLRGQKAYRGARAPGLCLGLHSARSAPSFLKRPLAVASSFWPVGSTCAPLAMPVSAGHETHTYICTDAHMQGGKHVICFALAQTSVYGAETGASSRAPGAKQGTLHSRPADAHLLCSHTAQVDYAWAQLDCAGARVGSALREGKGRRPDWARAWCRVRDTSTVALPPPTCSLSRTRVTLLRTTSSCSGGVGSRYSTCARHPQSEGL